MTVQERIAKLRERMEAYGIDIYIVPTADYHQSEYVGDFFKCREYMTGFTGSAGTAVFTKEAAFLWTDGRYFIQAAKELEGSGIVLQKSGEPGVPGIGEWLEAETQKAEHAPRLGFDGRTVSIADRIFRQNRRFRWHWAMQETRLRRSWNVCAQRCKNQKRLIV